MNHFSKVDMGLGQQRGGCPIKAQSIFLFLFPLLALDAAAKGELLSGLREEHPRVIATAADFVRVKELVLEDELASRWYAQMQARGEELITRPIAKRELRDGIRLLFVSREVKDLVETLAFLYRIENDQRYLERVWLEIEAVCGFEDWGTNHFLDVSEMVFAVGLAYDWLYHDWSDDQRLLMRRAIVRLGLQPSLTEFEKGVWWTKTRNNWAQVCNASLMIAALAIGDVEPKISEQVLKNGLGALPRAMARYAPDGGSEEGPVYWAYGTGYNTLVMAALESALGHDFRLGELKGFAKTGCFVPHLTGPTGKAFNFADCGATTVKSPALFYLASRYEDILAAQYAVRSNLGNPFDLLWYDPELLRDNTESAALHATYSRVGVITMRTAWGDPDAAYVGIKGGKNGFSHGQLDLGSFIYECRGQRWFIDLGADHYNLPGYFAAEENGKRWDYYRNRAEGHNTLVVNPAAGPDQPIDAEAPVELDGNIARVDLSEVNGSGNERLFAFSTATGALTVTDHVHTDGQAEAWWFAHTRASIDLSGEGRTARLSQNGEELLVRIIEPATARFEVMDAKPLGGSPNPVGQNPNNGAKLLNGVLGNSKLHVGVIPQWGDREEVAAIRKLAIHFSTADEQIIQVEIGAAK